MINDQKTMTNETGLVLFEGEKPNSTLDGISWFLPVYCTPHSHKIQVNNDCDFPDVIN